MRWDYTVVSTPSKLSNLSGFFFFSGFVIAKIQYIPIIMVSSALTIISHLLYMLGYACWFLSSHLFPNHTPKKNEWYGFAQFKEQYLFAATLGFIATSFSIAALFAPVLLIPAAWIFLGGNFMWASGEYHKLNNPPPYDKNYSHSQQNAYFAYSVTITSMTVVAAINTTLVFIFPPIAVPMFIITTVIGVGLNALALEIWLNFTFGNHKPTPVQTSHDQMNQTLGPKVLPEESDSLAPYHDNDLLKSSKPIPPQPEPQPEPDNIPLSDRTCSIP